MKIYFYWAFWIILLFILELPLFKRIVKYYKEIELSRTVATAILIFIVFLIIYGIANSILLLVKFVLK